MMETLGQFLKREREFRGISLEGLSKTTRISADFLKKIEEDRFDDLPKGAFVKGFLKAYVQYVGLNENEILARYQGLEAGSSSRPEPNPFRKFEGFEVKNQIVLIILFLVIVIVLATFLSSR